jgi:WD40 repeat protein/DNA-binding SARP family transcriptional activator
MAATRLDFRILGPLAVRVDGEPVALGGPKQRALLALLLLAANRVVSRERMIAELFSEQSVTSAEHALRNQVWRVRKALTPIAAAEPRLVARAPGYLLRVEPGELDLERFERLVADGRELLAAGRPAASAEALRAAEALWEGRPLADLEFEPFARFEIERLEELRLAAIEVRIDAELALGRQLALVSELEGLAVEHPYRERFQAQLMLALYRSGRQAEGLEVYRRTWALMNDQLGLEPGVELQQLERAILVQDPALEIGTDGARSAAAPPHDICPFKGLAPFEAADAEFFFGRERLVEELAARVAETPLLAIVGASGSGKSSLLRAGLLPALECESLLVRPGEQPAPELIDVLAGVPPGRRLVLAVDQFEELFAASVAESDRRSFIETLVEAAWDPNRSVLVVIALRADFFGRLAPYVELADLVGPNNVLLGPMSTSELRRAIEGAAQRAGLDVEPALVDTLVEEVAGEIGGLPLLSTALLDLWREREGRALTLAAYQRTGGVRRAVGRHAEAAFRSLSEDEQQVAHRILLRLVSGGDGEPLIRRRVRRRELDLDEDERVARVLAALVERRMLVADDGTIELVHEALLEQWPRLADWLQEDVQGRALHRHLTQAATEWQSAARDPGELYRGARLAAALDWADISCGDAVLNRVEREFLDESRSASARANRRLRILLALAVVLLMAMVVAGAIALAARGSARSQATKATAQRLGAQALVEPSLERSLLLAREGVDLDDSLATRGNLLAALLRSPAAIGVAHEGSERVLDEALSSDGRVLAVRGDSGRIVLFDTRTLRRIGSPIPDSNEVGLFGWAEPLHALAFGPDHRTLAVGSTTGWAATLSLVAGGGHARTITSSARTLITEDVAFAPDGRAVATAEGIAGPTGPPHVVIAVRDVATGRRRAETPPISFARLVGYTLGGRFLLFSTAGTTSMLLDARTLRRARALPVGGTAALSPAGAQAAFGHEDGSVTLLDLHTGRRTALSGQASGRIETASFSPDGRMLATGADDGNVSIWDVGTRSLRENLEGHSATVAAAVFSPDARTLYTASYDGSVIAWDVSGTRRLGQSFGYGPGGLSTWSDVSPDGSMFALSPGPNRVTLWRSTTHRPIGAALRGPVGNVEGLAFSRDGTLLAAVGTGKVVLWEVRSRRIVRILSAGEHGAPGVAFSPDGRTLAIGQADGVGVLYDLRTGRETASLGRGGGPSIVDMDFSSDGKLLASANLAGTATLWDVRTRTTAWDLSGAAVAAFAIRFSPDGRLVAVGDSSGRVVFWDPATGKRVGQPLVGHGGAVTSLGFDPRGATLVTASRDGKLRLWDVATRKLVGAPLPGSDTGGSVHFFPDGKRVLGVFESGSGIVWNVDPAAWKARACRVARRNLTRTEWRDFLPERRYRPVCP